MSKVTPGIIKSVMKAYYNLADEENYNVYDAYDIAEYLGLKEELIKEVTELLFDAGLLEECMSYHDDGVETYVLNDKAIDMVEMG